MEVSKIWEMVIFSSFEDSVASLIHPLGFLVWESLDCITTPKEVSKISRWRIFSTESSTLDGRAILESFGAVLELLRE